MTDLHFNTIDVAIELARKLEVAAQALRVLQAHPTVTSLQAAHPALGAVFDVVPTYMKEAAREFQRAALAASVPVASA